MKDKVTQKNEFKSYLGLIISIILIIGGITFAIYNYVLSTNAITKTAIVTEIKYGSSNIATVQYTVEGKTYTATKKVGNATVNDEIKITYDKRNPSKLINNEYYYYIAIAMFIVGLIIFKLLGLKGISNLKKNKKITKLKKEGIQIEADLTEILINNQAASIAGSFPYRIRAKYLNPSDNREYFFESPDYYININKLVENQTRNKVKIYLNKNNTNEYYIDLSSLKPDIPLLTPGNMDPNALSKSSTPNSNIPTSSPQTSPKQDSK